MLQIRCYVHRGWSQEMTSASFLSKDSPAELAYCCFRKMQWMALNTSLFQLLSLILTCVPQMCLITMHDMDSGLTLTAISSLALLFLLDYHGSGFCLVIGPLPYCPCCHAWSLNSSLTLGNSWPLLYSDTHWLSANQEVRICMHRMHRTQKWCTKLFKFSFF